MALSNEELETEIENINTKLAQLQQGLGVIGTETTLRQILIDVYEDPRINGHAGSVDVELLDISVEPPIKYKKFGSGNFDWRRYYTLYDNRLYDVGVSDGGSVDSRLIPTATPRVFDLFINHETSIIQLTPDESLIDEINIYVKRPTKTDIPRITIKRYNDSGNSVIVNVRSIEIDYTDYSNNGSTLYPIELQTVVSIAPTESIELIPTTDAYMIL